MDSIHFSDHIAKLRRDKKIHTGTARRFCGCDKGVRVKMGDRAEYAGCVNVTKTCRLF